MDRLVKKNCTLLLSMTQKTPLMQCYDSPLPVFNAH